MQTKEQLEQRAAELFNNPMVPEYTNIYNQQAWVDAVLRLGTKWLLATPQPSLNKLKEQS